MSIEKKVFDDPIIDAVPVPMIASFEADADVAAGDFAYLTSAGVITADDDGNSLFGIILNDATSGSPAQVFYHGYAGNKWNYSDAQRYLLAQVGVVIRPYVS